MAARALLVAVSPGLLGNENALAWSPGELRTRLDGALVWMRDTSCTHHTSLFHHSHRPLTYKLPCLMLPLIFAGVNGLACYRCYSCSLFIPCSLSIPPSFYTDSAVVLLREISSQTVCDTIRGGEKHEVVSTIKLRSQNFRYGVHFVTIPSLMIGRPSLESSRRGRCWRGRRSF